MDQHSNLHREVTTESTSGAGTGLWSGLLSSPWLWGGVLTWGFYKSIPYSGKHREFLDRYFCSHPLEYAQAGLFFVGIVVLVLRSVQYLTERQAASMPLPALPDLKDASACSRSLLHAVAQLPARLQYTAAIRRLADIADYLRHRRDGDGLESHAQHLSESAADRQHDGYGSLQTIIWAVPILGFLGTVMGITLAIANVTPEQLDTSLNSVTGGLAVAFDTTAVALGQSIVLVFASFFMKRNETRLLTDIDEKVFKGLVSPLAGAARQSSPMVEAETRAAETLLTRTETLITQQTDLWQQSIESLRARWTQTLDYQQRELASALSGGVNASLGDHADLLHGLRQEFLAAYQEISAESVRQREAARQQQAEDQEQIQTAWRAAWGELRDQLQQERQERTQASADLLAGFAAEVQQANRQLAATTEAIQSQFDALSRQTDLLTQIAGGEEQLAGLQVRLTENLAALKAAESLEETLHSLNAAIHLLTARTRPIAA
ncbi:MAG: MotA/TolQ/ExbB proton channel family protein [Planctomycetaceae bacterium]